MKDESENNNQSSTIVVKEEEEEEEEKRSYKEYCADCFMYMRDEMKIFPRN